MKIKNLKIGTQLKLGFAVILLLIVTLGLISFFQSSKLHEQTETIFHHPMQVRTAIDLLNYDILQIRINMRGLPLVKDVNETDDILNNIKLLEADANIQIDTLQLLYLGPPSDIDSILVAMQLYCDARNKTILFHNSGQRDSVINRLRPNGKVTLCANDLMKHIKVVSSYAKNKSKSLYETSAKLKDFLNWQLLIIVFLIVLLSGIIYFILLTNIRKPIDILTHAAQRFHAGDMSARSSFKSPNELGKLSASFNMLAEDIQVNTELGEKVSDLSGLMLSEYDVKKFFQAFLNAIASHTNSQMAAVYLLSDDKKSFQHFESLGVDDNARKNFSAESFEGEFGTVIATRQIQHIKNIPDSTRFVFHTVSGKFIPHEIITIPIIVDNEINAIISLSSINSYNKQSLQLIETMLVALSARVEGILAYHKIKEFSNKLENQNLELEAQKTELTSQSAELTEQNTELEIQKNQLNEANRLKTSFLSNMSHELRTPLNSVIALSGVLNRRLVNQIPNEEYSYLEVIERNGKHLLELINNILDISRIEAGREEVEITFFNANTVVADVVNMIQPQAKQKNISIIQTNSTTDLRISSDSVKFVHIIQNLISNAVKFTEKGQVEIAGKLTEKHIEITVRDTGIGIAENQIPHIFDEFRQADGSTSRKYGGTGLGLAIALKYAKLLGGIIKVTSSINKGSEFTLILPLTYNKKNTIIDSPSNSGFNQPIKQSVHKTVSPSSKKTILLVEDNESVRIQMKDFLEESSYQIIIANNGTEALQIISKTIPDAIILDLMMPEIDGFQLLETIRNAELTSNIPVLILTAKHITKEELSFLRRNNIHQLIQKGDVNRAELLSAINSMVYQEAPKTTTYPPQLQNIEGKPVILIVEDNPDNMITTRALLEPDYTVIEAEDGIKSIEMARQYKPNLILMDIDIPEINGIEAFTIIRKDAMLQHIPVIALTASAMIADQEAILSHGFDAYLAKPIEDKLFYKTINETLYGK